MLIKLLFILLCKNISYQSPPRIKNVRVQYLLSRGMYFSFFNVSEHSRIFNYDLTQDTIFSSSISTILPLPRFRKITNETTEICPYNNNKCNTAYKFTDIFSFDYYQYHSVLKTFTNEEFPIFKLDELNDENFFDVIGLSYKRRDSKNSFISNLNRIISNNNFGFSKINKTSNTGNVVFGGLGSYSLYHVSCKVNRTFSFWGCDLQGILFRNNKNKSTFYKVGYYSLFQVNQTQMTAPIEFINEIIKPAFIGKLLKDGICKAYVSKFIERYMCQCNYIKNMPNITLIFNGDRFGVDIPIEQLFEEYGSECKFLIEGSLYKDFNHIIIGSSLFNHLDTFFDAKNSKVLFYNDVPFKNTIGDIVNSIQSKLINVFSLINFTIRFLLIYILYLIIVYIKLPKLIN